MEIASRWNHQFEVFRVVAVWAKCCEPDRVLKAARMVLGHIVCVPLRHVKVLGRYEFSMDEVVAGGDLQPLRDPNAFRGFDTES